MQIIRSLPCQDHGHISFCILTDVSVDSERLTPDLVPDCPFCVSSRTLSNWAYEFDKWAPSVVKVSYKVRCHLRRWAWVGVGMGYMW